MISIIIKAKPCADPLYSYRGIFYAMEYFMNIREYTINIGSIQPFSVIHMSDNHICLADSRDDERKIELCINRLKDFADGVEEKQRNTNSAMFEYVRENKIPLVHTGDLIDFVSHKNLEYASECFKGIAEAIVTAGNHEFSLYVGEAWEDEEYKSKSLADVERAFPDGIEFGVKYINNLKFITLYDGYYYILPKQLEAFKAEISDGKPFVLVMHNPLYSKDLYGKAMAGKDISEPPYLMGCPEELLKGLSEHRFKQQRADETTLEFLKICNECKNLKAVLTGHLHDGFVSQLDSGVPQLVADGAFRGIMYKINFI